MQADVAADRVWANAEGTQHGNIRPDASPAGLGLALKESNRRRFALAARQ
ncbi:MAG: hypothetical protein ACHQHL_15655 [Steroidobacterales bacterium]|jgi:hypothetical protein